MYSEVLYSQNSQLFHDVVRKEDVWASEKPAKSMVGHLKGKLQCNYRVG